LTFNSRTHPFFVHSLLSQGRGTKDPHKLRKNRKKAIFRHLFARRLKNAPFSSESSRSSIMAKLQYFLSTTIVLVLSSYSFRAGKVLSEIGRRSSSGAGKCFFCCQELRPLRPICHQQPRRTLPMPKTASFNSVDGLNWPSHSGSLVFWLKAYRQTLTCIYRRKYDN